MPGIKVQRLPKRNAITVIEVRLEVSDIELAAMRGPETIAYDVALEVGNALERARKGIPEPLSAVDGGG